MLDSSGIGTYIRNLVPRVLDALKSEQCALLGPVEAMRSQGLNTADAARLVEYTPNIYSLREQVAALTTIPRGTRLFWAPHYNIPILFPARQVATIHDICHIARPEFFPGLHRRLYSRLMFNAVRARAVAVLTVSEFTRQELINRLGFSPEHIRVVPNGVSDWWFEPSGLPMPYTRPYILAVGNVKPHKNLKRLLRAFRTISDRIPHDIVLIGRLEGMRSTDDLGPELARLGLSGRVVFTDRISDLELKSYLEHASALVFPSLYEGFGLPPLEAMACGCPVAASRAAAIPEICANAAIYFDPCDVDDIAEKLLKLLESSDLARILTARGRARACEFSWDTAAREVSSVLSSLL